MASWRVSRSERIMGSYDPPTGVAGLVGMRSRRDGTWMLAMMRTCCTVATGELRSRRRLTRAECHAAWDDLAVYLMDRCDCPHAETPEGAQPRFDRLLAVARAAFLASTRDRLPVPAGWVVRDMDEFEERDQHQED
jgi:hypothetical protein